MIVGISAASSASEMYGRLQLPKAQQLYSNCPVSALAFYIARYRLSASFQSTTASAIAIESHIWAF